MKRAYSRLPISREPSLAHAAPEAFIGPLNFPQATTINSFARGMLKPPYLILYSPPYCSALSPLVRRTHSSRYAILLSLPHRVLADRRSCPHYVFFTDASYEEAPVGRAWRVFFPGGIRLPPTPITHPGRRYCLWRPCTLERPPRLISHTLETHRL